MTRSPNRKLEAGLLLVAALLGGCSFYARGADDYRKAVRAVLDTRQKQVEDCYKRTLQTDAKATGKVVVKNTGGTPVNGFATSVTDNGTTVGTQTASLAPGASTTLTFTWKAMGGTRTVTAFVDPRNLVAESDETDNKKTATVK